MARNDARFSTYSGAPSLQPSIASSADGKLEYSLAPHLYDPCCSDRTYLTAPMNTARSRSSEPRGPSSPCNLASAEVETTEMREVADFLEKMSDKRLDKQRYVMSGDKTEEVGKIALGAKVERALGRRMVGQDAVFTPKKTIDEKRALAVAAV